jgi:hypothetical protein
MVSANKKSKKRYIAFSEQDLENPELRDFFGKLAEKSPSLRQNPFSEDLAVKIGKGYLPLSTLPNYERKGLEIEDPKIISIPGIFLPPNVLGMYIKSDDPSEDVIYLNSDRFPYEMINTRSHEIAHHSLRGGPEEITHTETVGYVNVPVTNYKQVRNLNPRRAEDILGMAC